MKTQFLSRKQAAEYLSVKPDTIRKWQNKGKIKAACFVNDRPRYSLEDLTKVFNLKTPTTDGK